MKYIYVVGTADTKGDELSYLAGKVSQRDLPVLRVDVGTRKPTAQVDISANEVARHHPHGATEVLSGGDRGAAVSAMGEAFTRFLASRDDIAGIIGIGGGGGTSIITSGMRALPYGLPKIMVSTLASGDVAPYVDISDIIMMPSVTDFAGLNQFSRMILHNAAQAISGMAGTPFQKTDAQHSIGLTMFGVTTSCVMSIVEHLEASHDCMVFHATGVGGRTMEKLVDDKVISGVLDITTTEVCDLLLGGVLPATEDRFGAIARTRVPYVGSVGALDMVNFWGPDSVPPAHSGRVLYRHNPNVTLMRTTREECKQIGQWIGRKLNACDGPVRFLIPELGISALDIEGGAFFDPEANAALFSAIEATVKTTSNRKVERLPLHINDPAFAKAAADIYLTIT